MYMSLDFCLSLKWEDWLYKIYWILNGILQKRLLTVAYSVKINIFWNLTTCKMQHTLPHTIGKNELKMDEQLK